MSHTLGRTAGFTAVLVVAAGATALAAETVLISAQPDGTSGKLKNERAFSESPSISDDGTLVAFESNINKLVKNDKGAYDVFVRDVAAGKTRLVDLNNKGEKAKGGAFSPAISADGRFVAFSSPAPNLVRPDTNTTPCDGEELLDDPKCGPRRASDIFVRDLKRKKIERVSLSSSGKQANDSAFNPSISRNGRYVEFETSASNLAKGEFDDEIGNVYVHDRRTGKTELVSARPNGKAPLLGGENGYLSDNGRYVAFTSYSDELLPKPMNKGFVGVYLRDLKTNTTTRIDIGVSGAPVRAAFADGISASGRYVLFSSSSAKLVDGDTNKDDDVFVRDTHTNTTTRVSLSSTGAELAGENAAAAISADGRRVAFWTNAEEVVPGVKPKKPDLYEMYARDVVSGAVEHLSATVDGKPASEYTHEADLTADGAIAVFTSRAKNLTTTDKNKDDDDVFLRSPLFEAP